MGGTKLSIVVRKAGQQTASNGVAVLTAREIEVGHWLSCGKTNREIAQELHLGDGTVRNYVSNILDKLGVANRAEAAAYAIKHHLHGLD